MPGTYNFITKKEIQNHPCERKKFPMNEKVSERYCYLLKHANSRSNFSMTEDITFNFTAIY